ncbi:DUF429 domain-containing protein [Variovorax sp. PCZ-1]|uniref:DUF429 domain-containing protein n=1 Tax=Variovorax sp. PCZ-1 TaxID=2835533 RepID=UPI001BCDC9B1|nr:DUF429 domain-containing protein [Variovorax sp. PCZ-1]MBS7806646.1 DUF429 domain-containing protein [Variovorax sp. PCZ-1]
MQIIGCDFSSSPSKRKPVVVALSEEILEENGSSPAYSLRSVLLKLERFDSLQVWGDWLKADRKWIGGFDLPFGLPRELVETLQWPLDWHACMQHYTSLSREEIRATFKAFCDARPVGGKFAHRAADLPAGSSPSMKWVNPPVAYMLHAGVPLLLQAGCHFPGLHQGHPNKVALEAYPGLLAREIIGSRSYKSDDKAKQTPERLIARKDILTALENGQTKLKVRLKLSNAQREQLIDDASGDSLDATLCMLQAHWAYGKHLAGKKNYGLPKFDALEGWIITA